ncbi:uncharacterized protein LOC102457665 [Pelodiscus sinensis]|uniref:uncharacterized protein LOC102457665 n=1 Tax=Pelodiscus sinensis TaxID=13735 RepID=UPI003F6AEB99
MAYTGVSPIEIPALGRPFRTGMLYDCRSDILIPGITLWGIEALKRDVETMPNPKTEFQIITSDTMEDKASALNLSGSLKASILGGLVEVGGSAAFFNDTKKSKYHARVALHYSVTTRYEQLTMSHLGTENISYPAVFDQGTATHVVTAVLYGAQAFFVFNREVSSSENMIEIEGKMKLIVEKIPKVSGVAEGSGEMKNKEIEKTENLSCKFYGDFALENNPVTYQDALGVYSTLPKLLGDSGEKAVPVRVWLYPLSKLDPRAAQLVREISSVLVDDAQSALEHLTKCDVRCNDMEKNRAATAFPEIGRKIQQFRDLCKQHRQSFQEELARTLPLIRGGDAEEGALMEILTSKEQSPFVAQRLNEFLDKKQEELDFVGSYLAELEGVEVVPSRNELQRVVLSPGHNFVVSLTLTSLHDEEPYFSELNLWLRRQLMKKPHDPALASPTGKTPNSALWFEDDEIRRKAQRAVKSFSDFARVNKSNGKTRFIVASVLDEANPGASIYLYENREVVSTNFEPPSKPRPPSCDGVRHDRVQLTLKPAACGRAEICGYRAEYRLVGQENWVAVNVSNTQETLTVTGLRPNTQYQFRYAAVSKPGLSESSDVSDTVKTLPTSPPGKPLTDTVAQSAIDLTWESPNVSGDGVVITEYKVEYKEQVGSKRHMEKEKWLERRTGQRTESCTIDGLKPQTPYRFRVLAVCADGAVSDPSEETLISTPKRKELKKQPPHSPKESPVTRDKQPPTSLTKPQIITQHFVKQESLLARGPPAVYTLPLEKTGLGPTASYTKYRLGKETLQIPNKVIMVMGATGSGKTTLINGMINYVLGVQWKDEFRFQLIHEITNRSQAESQTPEVMAYEVNHTEGFQVPYSLTIIDTPGFGDTRGIEQDKEILRKVREFFSSPGAIDHIDAVCFVVQATLARLTHAQRYVFDSVLSIFGKDIKDNIQILVTFADGETPPVLEAIKTADVPCAKDAQGNPVYFKFNNSVLFACNAAVDEGRCKFVELFWEMGARSMQTFFGALLKLETRSLTLTQEVLRERKELEVAVEGLQPQIKAGLVKLEELRKTQEALEQHTGDMEANRNFEYEVEKTVPVKIDISGTGRYITNCQKCHYTCHYPCIMINDANKGECAAMDKNTGRCTVCSGHCDWSDHFNQKYKFDYKVVKEKRTYAQLKEKYEKASGEVLSTQNVVEKLSQEYAAVEEILMELIDKSSRSLQRLQEIALKPNPLSTLEYIDLLIMSEQQEVKPGYQERIKSLQEVREVAEIVRKIANKLPLLPAEENQYKKLQEKKAAFKKIMKKPRDLVKSWFQ